MKRVRVQEGVQDCLKERNQNEREKSGSFIDTGILNRTDDKTMRKQMETNGNNM